MARAISTLEVSRLDVEGDEWPARTDGDASGRAVEGSRSVVGTNLAAGEAAREAPKSALSNLGQGAPGRAPLPP